MSAVTAIVGHFVQAVAQIVDTAIEAGLITEEEGDAIQSAAAQSSIGKPAKSGKKPK